MRNERCLRCQSLPRVDLKKGNVYFIAPIEILLNKIELLLSNLGYKIERREDYLACNVNDFRDFLIDLSKVDSLSSVEFNDIRILFLQEGETLGLSNLRDIKPLYTYLSLVKESEYIEILNEKRLTVHFHPVIETKNLEIIGYECLIRGIRKDGSLVAPFELFDIASRTDTLFFLDRACRETALRSVVENDIKDKMIFINFLPTSIYDPKFCLRETVNLSKELSINPESIVFEVVETYRVKDLIHLKNILDFYRDEGFRVALDDLGTGYSNIEALIKLYPDIIKIDKTIIRDVDKSPINQNVFKALTQMAKESGIDVLAEGIESKEELEFVRDMIDFVQGFYFAKPSPKPIKCWKE